MTEAMMLCWTIAMQSMKQSGRAAGRQWYVCIRMDRGLGGNGNQSEREPCSDLVSCNGGLSNGGSGAGAGARAGGRSVTAYRYAYAGHQDRPAAETLPELVGGMVESRVYIAALRCAYWHFPREHRASLVEEGGSPNLGPHTFLLSSASVSHPSGPRNLRDYNNLINGSGYGAL
ncbi:uncharacterized protein MYCFIDRAFT_207103 [Pseudocercospora fijiensis CIRAD86]|uniref:Uncharacterized protein n=1 Tax=Pseudocercospora fijiensis (strain CIRAD86) TaxID=383855 RepID=M3B3I2_PSEFD|nr:uncharacterized protein MYCFIDRAFT_207103 [Pseudocercospora fijiensis CIRAD86]EME83932.1 hypothetical protein MYCFIDRAFT_207103 [Pseudocercospora fijiensis CIRAD86]